MGAFKSFVTKSAIISSLFAVIILVLQQSFRFEIRNFFTGPGSVSRIILLCIILANLKALPLVWHARLLGALFRHQSTPRNPEKSSRTSIAVFQPVITTSYSPLAECDLNLHKSNATFFSDLDITRLHLVSHLFDNGIKKLKINKGLVFGRDGKIARGPVNFMLGAVQCSFSKEIKPYETYEMWSRILTWDSKWIYVVTHFVKKGAARRAGYALATDPLPTFQSQKGAPRTVKQSGDMESKSNDQKMSMSKLVFASAISKQVVKKGRISVDPEVVLTASGLLPPKPASRATTGDEDWESIESARQKGLEFAKSFGMLDGLAGEFAPESARASGMFSDLFL